MYLSTAIHDQVLETVERLTKLVPAGGRGQAQQLSQELQDLLGGRARGVTRGQLISASFASRRAREIFRVTNGKDPREVLIYGWANLAKILKIQEMTARIRMSQGRGKIQFSPFYAGEDLIVTRGGSLPLSEDPPLFDPNCLDVFR